MHKTSTFTSLYSAGHECYGASVDEKVRKTANNTENALIVIIFLVSTWGNVSPAVAEWTISWHVSWALTGKNHRGTET